MTREREGNLKHRLRDERLSKGWSQQQVADCIGTTPNNVSRWELGVTAPGPYFRIRLCELFAKTEEELGLLRKRTNEATSSLSPKPTTSVEDRSPPIWNLPFRRNPYFTGREDILRRLYDTLHQGRNIAVMQVISGLGGVGKTQTAIEYAYRYREHYQAVLWLQASTQHELSTSVADLAEALRISESRQEQDQKRITATVQRWLREHDRWLLVVDNVEDMSIFVEILPMFYSGHVLLTTHNQVAGKFAHGLILPTLSPQEGAAFLLRRAKRIWPTADLEEAEASEHACAIEITQLMGSLPLALDQAAAYLEETACSLPDYLRIYQTQKSALLSLRGAESTDHPLSVTATFALALAQVEQADPAAADLLRFCAFLHPDAVPEDLFTAAAPELGNVLQRLAADPLALDMAIGVLRRFSLLSRHTETKTLAVHRMVQAVLRDRMGEEMQRSWAERVVRAVNLAFPESEGPSTWTQCQRYLPHALACLNLIDQWQIPSEAATRLLYKAGIYLVEGGRCEQAEPLLLQAHHLRVQGVGLDHPECATSLNGLGSLRFRQGRYAQAEQLFQQALALRKRLFPSDHADVLESTSDLAVTYQEQGRYGEAAQLLQRILEVKEQTLSPVHPEVGHALRNLAIVLRQLGRYDEALSQLTRALSIYEQTQGFAYEEGAFCHEQLGLLFRDLGQDEVALQHFQRSLTTREQASGPEDLKTSRSLYLLGSHYRKLGRYREAFPLLTLALSIRQRTLGPTHIMTALSLQSLGIYHLEQRAYTEAEPLPLQSLAILEQELGAQHPNVGNATFHLARVYAAQEQYVQAEPLYQRAIAAMEQALGEEHPALITCMEGYAGLLRKTRHPRQAAVYESRARKIGSTRAGHYPRSTADGTGSNPRSSPSFANFLAECCDIHAQAWSRAGGLWRSYERWVEKRGETAPLSRRAFAQQLTEYGCHAARTKHSRLWCGIAVKPEWRSDQGDANF
jgi:tetratricopeptide (TPR) repeat protein/transcriptional regulator with XRE-family HTH domain